MSIAQAPVRGRSTSGRNRHLGDTTDRLPAHARRSANHEPRGCARGASYSWYLYSANRLKYPLVRGRLLRSWRDIRRHHDPVDAWAEIVESESKRRDYQQVRGLGGFVRASWKEVNELIAAANAYTDQEIRSRPRCRLFADSCHVDGFPRRRQPLSEPDWRHALSFYDWYCDLPPSSPQVWGEQTDVPESADWYNSNFIIAWGSNVPQTRTPDAHFFTEVRYRGHQDRRRHARLLRSGQAFRFVAASQGRHRRGSIDGDGA